MQQIEKQRASSKVPITIMVDHSMPNTFRFLQYTKLRYRIKPQSALSTEY